MSSSRDIERYAGLFASRTKVMKSSAMRDLMAVTARPEGMGADLEDVLVTTGGQQVIDLVTKTLIDPGDVVIAEGPTYPGAVSVFTAYQADVVQIDMDADGMRVELLEETLDRLDREDRRPKFIYTVPSFQNPAGVTMSAPRRRRLVEVAHERELLVLEDNPYGLLRYEGDAPTPLLKLDGGVYVMYLGTFSKILSPGIRLGWVVAPPPVLEKINLGKQAADLCTSTLSQLMVQAYFAEGRWRNAMRLNYSGSDEDAIREGIRRIGEVVTEQVQLYGTLTGEHEAVEPPPVEAPPVGGADVLQMPDRAERKRRAGY